ncbi:MAG: metallophosphoesterase family protein [Candidatus Heimdallarchaeaceae archaeon]
MNKKRLSGTLIAVILFSMLVGTSSVRVKGIDGAVIENNGLGTLVSYNATSPEEYFNETKNPRYALVNKPLTLLYYPNKGYPIITECEKEFNIIVSASKETTNWNLSLVSEVANISLDVLNTRYDTEKGRWILRVKADQGVEGLFDLKLVCSSGTDYQTHSVKLLEKFTYPFTFVQISDSHFPGYSLNINTTANNLKVIEKVKELKPDFVIHTGDLIDGPSTVFVNPVTGKPLAAEVQVKLALWALDQLDVPVFLIAGNHDFEESNLLPDNPEEVWHKYFGYNPIQNFSYLDWDFTGYSASFEGLVDVFFEQLNTHLAAINNGSDVLYYHFDFQKQASSMLKKYHIELALWGHEHQEKLYLSQGTLYHCQEPMFYSEDSFTLFTIENKNNFTVNNELYDTSTFSWSAHSETSPTQETPYLLNFALFLDLLLASFYIVIKRKNCKVEH